MKKYKNLYLKAFSFGGEIFNIFEYVCFHNVKNTGAESTTFTVNGLTIAWHHAMSFPFLVFQR